MEIKRLLKHEFDSLENHNPVTITCVGTFVNDDAGTTARKIDRYFKENPVILYTGYDGNVYPSFVIKTETTQ